MIVTRTPYRISFFGGGTDYPVWYREHGGATLSTTINKYCHICCRFYPPFFDNKYLIRYSTREEAKTVSDIMHPSARECLRYLEISKGVEIIHSGDIPARSGVGSSSSFTVGLLNALYALSGKMTTKRQLARDAIHVEQNLIGENVGSQDQVAAAFGGFNKIEFGGEREFYVQPIPIGNGNLSILESHLMLFFTGLARSSSEIAGEQIKKTPERKSELKTMHEMVEQAIQIIAGNSEDIIEFGKLLHESWKIKRSLTGLISNSRIDSIYETALRAGAVGGKLLGAGGGGFIMFFVSPKNRAKVMHALKDLLYVPMRFENLGTQVVLYSTQDFS